MIVIVENYRAGLVWQLLRGCRYVVAGFRTAGFAGGWLAHPEPASHAGIGVECA